MLESPLGIEREWRYHVMEIKQQFGPHMLLELGSVEELACFL